MRRYPSGRLLYCPGDPVVVALGDERYAGRIMSHPKREDGKYQLYRVSVNGEIRDLWSSQFVKQCDTGGLGFVKHEGA